MLTQNSPFSSMTVLHDKKPYTQPSLIEYGDINAVTHDLELPDLLSVTVVAAI